MRRIREKEEKPPVRLLGTMFLLVLGLVVVYMALALGIASLVQRLVHLEDTGYTLLWPILILTISAVLGVLLAVFIFRGYLAPLSRLMQATQSVAAGDYAVRVEMRGARGEVAEYIRSFNKMAEELSCVALLRMDFVNTFSHEFKTPLISLSSMSSSPSELGISPLIRESNSRILPLGVSPSEDDSSSASGMSMSSSTSSSAGVPAMLPLPKKVSSKIDSFIIILLFY